MIRLALVGYGKWGRNYVRAAQDSGLAQVVCGMATTAGERDGIPVFGPNPSHYEDMAFHVGGRGVDAFVLARNPAWAADTCERLLSLGKPVLVEKPAGLSLADAERIEAAERASKTFVLVGHQHLFAGAYEALRERVRHMSFPLEVASTGANHGPFRDYSPLWDYGPHDVAMLLGLGLGAISHVTCHKRDTGGGGERFHLAIDLERGRASIILSNGLPARTRFFDARHGRWFINYDDRLEGPRLSSSDGLIGFESGQPLTRAVRAFAQAIEDGGTDDYRFGARWAVDVARVLDAAERACLVGGVDF